MITKIFIMVWLLVFGSTIPSAQISERYTHVDGDEYWIGHELHTDETYKAALAEFDSIYDSIELEVTIVTRKCGRYDAAPKRQVIIKRDGKFVGGKVLGYATAFHFHTNAFGE